MKLYIDEELLEISDADLISVCGFDGETLKNMKSANTINCVDAYNTAISNIRIAIIEGRISGIVLNELMISSEEKELLKQAVSHCFSELDGNPEHWKFLEELESIAKRLGASYES